MLHFRRERRHNDNEAKMERKWSETIPLSKTVIPLSLSKGKIQFIESGSYFHTHLSPRTTARWGTRLGGSLDRVIGRSLAPGVM